MVRNAALVFLSVSISACTTHRAVEEFGAYREAFQLSRGASDAVIDRLAVAERSLWRHCANYVVLISTVEEAPEFTKCEKFDIVRTEFRVQDTAYLVASVDPPQAGAFRRTIIAVGAYTEALNALAAGQTAEAVAGQIGQIASLAATAAATVTTGGAAGTLAGAVASINENVGALQMPIAAAFGFAARGELRDQLLAQGGTIKKALSAVMDASPAMFKVFVAAEIVATPAGSSPSLDRIGEDRMLLANWVEMLKATERALDASVAAAGSGDAPTMGEALAATQTLATIADDLRRILAGSGE